METTYNQRERMGVWARGTAPEIKKEMSKKIRELRQSAAVESSESDVIVPARKDKGKGKGKGKGKKAAPQSDHEDGRFQEVKDSQDEENGGDLSPPLILPPEESQSSYYPDRDSESPPPPPPTSRKAKTIVNVVVEAKAPAKTSHPPTATKASSSSSVPVVVIKTPVKKPAATPKTQKRLDDYFGKQQAAPTTQAQTAASNPSAKKGKMRASVATSPGQDTDDSAAVQLKAEGSPKAGQKRRRSAKTYQLTTDDEDELASGPSLTSKPLPKTPHSSASTSDSSSVKKTSRSSTKKRRTSAKPPPTAEFEVERIVDHIDDNGTKKYLVKWVGYPSSENTYVLISSFLLHYLLAVLTFFPAGNPKRT
jgi:hypothetical protein